MDTKGKKIILGSNSPRRKELLAGLDIDFTVDTGNTFEEVYDEDTPHERIPEVLSEGKSYGFHRQLEADEILVTSDTLVLCEERVMGKPHSREEAIDMLRHLPYRAHPNKAVPTVPTTKSGPAILAAAANIVRFRLQILPC